MVNALAYLDSQPDADLLKQMLGLIPTPTPVRDPRKGGRPKGLPHQQRRSAAEHGTYYAYKHLRCRCGPCREANNASQRAYYQRRKARDRDRV